MWQKAKVNIQVLEEEGKIITTIELEPRKDKEEKIKYTSSDIVDYVELQTRHKILSVIENCMVSNYNLDHLKGKWVFEIEKKEKVLETPIALEEVSEEVIKVTNKLFKNKKKEIDE